MLKIRKSNFKIFGIISCLTLLSMSYIGLSFYSVPEKVHAETIKDTRTLSDISTMQQMTVEICNNSAKYESKALVDTRGGGYTNDGTAFSYTVAKLDDGNCWMTQNMKLYGKKLTPADSNVKNDNYTIPAVDSAPWTGSSYNINKTYYDSANEKNGTYYSWFAATAGTSGNIMSLQTTEASICPKGWMMPSRAENAGYSTYKYSYDNLISKGGLYGGNATKQPYYFSASSGYVSEGEIKNFGTAGYYWTGTADTNSGAVGAYYVMIPSKLSEQLMVNNLLRYNGMPVRCVSNPDIHSSALFDPIDTWDSQVAVSVGPTISIDAVTSLKGEVDYTTVLDKNITATVSANTDYQVLLSVPDQNSLNLRDENNTEFAGIPASETIEAGVSGWGIYNGKMEGEKKLYDRISTYPSPYYYTSELAVDGKATTYTYGIGISVAPSVPNGTYSTVVTVTAVNA